MHTHTHTHAQSHNHTIKHLFLFFRKKPAEPVKVAHCSGCDRCDKVKNRKEKPNTHTRASLRKSINTTDLSATRCGNRGRFFCPLFFPSRSHTHAYIHSLSRPHMCVKYIYISIRYGGAGYIHNNPITCISPILSFHHSGNFLPLSPCRQCIFGSWIPALEVSIDLSLSLSHTHTHNTTQVQRPKLATNRSPRYFDQNPLSRSPPAPSFQTRPSPHGSSPPPLIARSGGRTRSPSYVRNIRRVLNHLWLLPAPSFLIFGATFLQSCSPSVSSHRDAGFANSFSGFTNSSTGFANSFSLLDISSVRTSASPSAFCA